MECSQTQVGKKMHGMSQKVCTVLGRLRAACGEPVQNGRVGRVSGTVSKTLGAFSSALHGYAWDEKLFLLAAALYVMFYTGVIVLIWENIK